MEPLVQIVLSGADIYVPRRLYNYDLYNSRHGCGEGMGNSEGRLWDEYYAEGEGEPQTRSHADSGEGEYIPWLQTPRFGFGWGGAYGYGKDEVEIRNVPCKVYWTF